MEIGSEFWIDPEHVYEENMSNPSWLKKFGENVQLLSTGRGAISLILDFIKPKLKTVLLPSYICNSVILPFEKDYEIKYYEIDKNLKPVNLSRIDWSTIGVFLHIGYFGFHTNDIVKKYHKQMKDNEVIIVEDVTHTLFSNYHNYDINDFVVGSIRKWFGVPSGGFVASHSKIEAIYQLENPEFILSRRKSLVLKNNYIKKNKKELKSKFLAGFNMAEEYIDKNFGARKIDDLSKKIITNLDHTKIMEKRRENYNYLIENIKKNKHFEIAIDEIGEGIVPFFFPIYITHDREKFRKNLINAEIFSPVHWPIPNQIVDLVTEDTLSIYDSIISIPCDQRYSLSDMDKIVNIIETNFDFRKEE